MSICRCCKNILDNQPILTYHNLPEKVQNFVKIGEEPTDTGIDLEIFQCRFCGLIQVTRQPVDYYRDVIRAVAVSEEMRDFRIEYFKQFVDEFDLKNKKIIEIGAGCGEYMNLMQTAAFNVFGLEHLKSSVEKATQNGLTVYEGFVENADYVIPGGPYDAFYIMNFLEHIPNLTEYIRGIYNNLSEDAYGLVEVPNGDFVIQNKMFSEFMLEHLSYFTKDTLRTVLENNGFEVLSCESIWHDYIISAKVRKRKSVNIEAFKECMNVSIDKLKSIIEGEKRNNHHVAVWGAGHQALTLLAMGNLGDCVDCVIDSAPFKQNRLTPVTHIPIYGKDYIEKEHIDTVIIMAGSYSTEVQKILAAEYPHVKSMIYS